MKHMCKIFNRIVPMLLSALLLTALTPVAQAADTAASDPTAQNAVASLYGGTSGLTATTLTVMVGYYGGPYYQKEVFYVSGAGLLDSSGAAVSGFYDCTYSFIDDGDQVVIDNASVIPLDVLMWAAGIDTNSVQWYHFRTGDNKTFSRTNSDLSALSYYYPGLESFSYADSVEEALAYNPDVVGPGYPVVAALAVWENWHNPGREGNSTTENAVRLLFGQEYELDSDAGSSAKWCYAVCAQLGGTPNLDVSVDLNDKIGSTYHVTVNFNVTQDDGRTTTIDAAVREQIAAGVTITSSNRNLLDVGQAMENADGSVSFDVTVGDGAGTASLSVAADGYGGSLSGAGVTAEVSGGVMAVVGTSGSVSVEAARNPGGETGGAAGGGETGGGESTGDDTPVSNSDNTTISQNDPNAELNVQSQSQTGANSNSQTLSDEDRLKTEADENALADSVTMETEEAPKVNSIRVQRLTIDSNDGGEQNWRETDMDEEAKELGLLDENDVLLVKALVFAAALLVLAYIVRYFQFLKQLGEL